MTDRTLILRTTGYIGPRRHVRVRIHPDGARFRAAAHALRPHPDGTGHWENCWGCFHPTSYRQHADTGAIRYPANGYAGTLRLVDPDSADYAVHNLPFTEIAAHELVHAAATIYRMNVARTVNLGGGHGRTFQREEDFAYIYGELADSFWRQMGSGR